MSTLKAGRKIDIESEVFTTVNFKIMNYTENKTVRAAFYCIKFTKKKKIVYDKQKKA